MHLPAFVYVLLRPNTQLMFGDMLGQMQQQQEALQQRLSEMRLEESSDGVSVTVSGTREVIAVKVDEQILQDGDVEQLEDLLLVSLNRALAKAAETEQAEAQKLMSGMLPGGMEGLSGLFGQ